MTGTIEAKCIQKIRDKNNKIIMYRLVDLNGNVQDFIPDNLKLAIDAKKIHVVNLTLAKDGRLMDTSEKRLPYDVKNQAVNTEKNTRKQVTENIQISDLAKAFTLVEWSYIDMGDDIEEVVNYMCEAAGINENAWDIHEKGGILNLLNKAHQVILNKNPGLLTNRLRHLLQEDGDYYSNQIKNYMYSEGVSKLSESKMYTAVSLIYKQFKDDDKKLAKIIKTELLDDMKQNGVASIRVGYGVGHEYFRYLDGKLFGTVTNDYFTVGHAITTDEKKEFKDLKPYSYMCRKDFNGLSPRPEVGMAFLFKNSTDKNKVDVDIKLFRRGYIGKSAVSVVGYIMDLDSFTLNINDKNNAKIVAGYCNDYAAWIRKFCMKHESLLHMLPLGAPIEKFN